MASKKTVAVAFRITAEQAAKLDLLHRMSRIPKSVLMREAVDDLLKKHQRRHSNASA